jgi:hypothetical protein
VVTDFHHLNEEQDPEPDPHESEAGSGSGSVLKGCRSATLLLMRIQ